MTSLCPITTDKRCRIIKNFEFINGFGDNNPNPTDISDLMTMIDLSDIILYNEDNLYRGRVKTLALNPANSGWLRLNVSNIDDDIIRSILRQYDCK